MTEYITVRREDLKRLVEEVVWQQGYEMNEMESAANGLIAELTAAVNQDVLPPLTLQEFLAQWRWIFESGLLTVQGGRNVLHLEDDDIVWDVLKATATQTGSIAKSEFRQNQSVKIMGGEWSGRVVRVKNLHSSSVEVYFPEGFSQSFPPSMLRGVDDTP